jgi:hypothetical protein
MDDSIMNEIVYTNWLNEFDGVYGCEIQLKIFQNTQQMLIEVRSICCQGVEDE